MTRQRGLQHVSLSGASLIRSMSGCAAPACCAVPPRSALAGSWHHARIVGLDDETVTIQYKERKTGRPRTGRLSGDEFMRRFLQHVLPRGFHKVRYFGLWHPAQRHNAARVRQMLQLEAPPKLDPSQDPI